MFFVVIVNIVESLVAVVGAVYKQGMEIKTSQNLACSSIELKYKIKRSWQKHWQATLVSPPLSKGRISEHCVILL